MDKSFDGEALTDSAGNEVAQLEQDQEAKLSYVRRSRAYLSRHKKSQDAGHSWRPTKIYRAAAKRWAVNIDCQLQHSTVLPGLSFFRKSLEPCWATWHTWPHIVFGRDLGPDGEAATWAFSHGPATLQLNCDTFDELGHGGNNDLKMTLRQVQLFQFWLLMLVSWNLHFGTDNDRSRYIQIRECMQAHFKRCPTPQDDPLFMSLCPKMIEQYKVHDMWEDVLGQTDEVTMYNMVKARQSFVTVGRKTNMCRFLDSIGRAETSMPHWWVDCWERLVLSLDCDFLKGKFFIHKLTLRKGHDGDIDSDAGPTNPHKLSVADQSLRPCCENAVCISVMVLQEDNHRRLVQQFLEPMQIVRRWCGEGLTELKCVDGNQQWIGKQANGACMGHINDIVKTLANMAALQRCGFLLDTADIIAESGAEAQTEDEFADYYGQMVMHLAFNRLKRTAHLTIGYPWSLTAGLRGEGALEFVMDKFSQDVEIWKAFCEFENKSAAERTVQKRHPFQTLSCQQLILGLEDGADVGRKQFLDVVRGRAKVAINAKICDDGFGYMKNSKKVNGPSTIGCPFVPKTDTSCVRYRVGLKTPRHRCTTHSTTRSPTSADTYTHTSSVSPRLTHRSHPDANTQP